MPLGNGLKRFTYLYYTLQAVVFGGEDLKTLLITTSNLNLSQEEQKENPLAGRCFAFETNVIGQIEPRFKT